MQSAVVGFPRVGKLRELKFVLEKYFKGEVGKEELYAVVAGNTKNRVEFFSR